MSPVDGPGVKHLLSEFIRGAYVPIALANALAVLIKVLLKLNRVKGLLKYRKTPSANQSPVCRLL